MANTFFKAFSEADRTSSRTLLHEVIPITGSMIHSTYAGATAADGNRENVKTFSHAMFNSVYDYPHLSSSANHIFDVSYGYSSNAVYSTASTNTDHAKKLNIYSQMAQILAGFNPSGSVREFDADGDLTAGTKHSDAFFINFSRLLVKDEIKKGSFSMILGTGSTFAAASDHASRMTITDTSALTTYYTNSPAGEYGILKASDHRGSTNVGLIYYQAGIAVLSSSVMQGPAGSTNGSILMDGSLNGDIHALATGSTISRIATGFTRRIHNISFNNTTELNSTIYFCRANHNEFNYSSNPTYLSSSAVRVKNNDNMNPPRSYVTTVGLYSADNELLAVAKLSEPLRKDPTNELTLRVRLDY